MHHFVFAYSSKKLGENKFCISYEASMIFLRFLWGNPITFVSLINVFNVNINVNSFEY
jgi:hypothetical protein